MQKKNQQVFDFMSLFTIDNDDEFKKKLGNFKDLMKNEEIEMNDVIQKKTYIKICSINIKEN